MDNLHTPWSSIGSAKCESVNRFTAYRISRCHGQSTIFTFVQLCNVMRVQELMTFWSARCHMETKNLFCCIFALWQIDTSHAFLDWLPTFSPYRKRPENHMTPTTFVLPRHSRLFMLFISLHEVWRTHGIRAKQI